jgi:hypothetical protein
MPNPNARLRIDLRLETESPLSPKELFDLFAVLDEAARSSDRKDLQELDGIVPSLVHDACLERSSRYPQRRFAIVDPGPGATLGLELRSVPMWVLSATLDELPGNSVPKERILAEAASRLRSAFEVKEARVVAALRAAFDRHGIDASVSGSVGSIEARVRSLPRGVDADPIPTLEQALSAFEPAPRKEARREPEPEPKDAAPRVRLIGEILVDMGVSTAEQIDDLLLVQEKRDDLLGKLGVERGYFDEKDVKRAIAEQNREEGSIVD